MIAGSFEKGVVEVTNCFAVPHNESEDEVRLLIIKTIYSCYNNFFLT